MKVLRALALGTLLAASLAQIVNAQDEKEERWFFTTEFAAVQTTGNAESSTFGLGATAVRSYDRSELRFELGGIRTESSLKTRIATGTSQDDFVLQTNEVKEKTAENYYARGRYDHTLSKFFNIFGGVDWMRNVFAGIDSRTLIGVGAANIWKDTDKVKFRTNYAATYTFEEEVVTNPFTESNFPGVRLSYNFFWTLTETTDFDSRLDADWNLDNTDDVRVDFENALPVEISSKMVLKPTIRMLWRNEPALVNVPLFDAGGMDTGSTVVTNLEELDTIFTLTLVVNI